MSSQRGRLRHGVILNNSQPIGRKIRMTLKGKAIVLRKMVIATTITFPVWATKTELLLRLDLMMMEQVLCLLNHQTLIFRMKNYNKNNYNHLANSSTSNHRSRLLYSRSRIMIVHLFFRMLDRRKARPSKNAPLKKERTNKTNAQEKCNE